MKNYLRFIFFAFGLFCTKLFASPATQNHVIIAPHCLVKSLNNLNIMATQVSFVLIKANDDDVETLIAAKQQAAKSRCGGFIDVTQSWDTYKNKDADAFLISQLKIPAIHKIDYKINYPEQTQLMIKQNQPQTMWNNLTHLIQYKDRYANSSTGIETATWFKNEIESLAAQYHRDDIEVTLVSTPNYKQPSVVVKIGKGNQSGILIGAHMDTLSGSWSVKPGADDDGSGSVTVLETARTLIASGMQFKKPIYFVWYAAEEEGLVGSGAIVSLFKKQQIQLDAVLHFDLTGYAYKNEKTMWLMDDYVNKDLVNFISQLITEYVKQPVKHSRCGYACSDHASWTQAGYPAAIPAEAAYEHSNPEMHSSRDTQDRLSLAHMSDYLTLATAFAVELAEPV